MRSIFGWNESIRDVSIGIFAVGIDNETIVDPCSEQPEPQIVPFKENELRTEH